MTQLDAEDDPRRRHPFLLPAVSLTITLFLLALLGHRLTHLEEFEAPSTESGRNASR